MGENTTVIDYTKYKLKKEDEIRELLKGIQKISILWCQKCYKEFKEDSEPECEQLRSILEPSSTEITVCQPIDFLCNNYLTEKILQEMQGGEPVGVISCGIGMQFVAGICKGRRILALADSVPQSGNATSIVNYHGIALGPEKCAGCGQCYLEITGGICPVVDCAKSLLNGPCGGASSDGRCEVNKELRCAWVQIYEKIKKQERSLSSVVEIRNYNIFKIDEKKKLEKLNRFSRAEGFYGGVHPLEMKELTEGLPLKNFPSPGEIVVFLSQHTGLPAKPVVKAGDTVRVGQKLGESTGMVSSPVHSGISGRVVGIEERTHPVSQTFQPAVIIENDWKDTLDSSVKPVQNPTGLSPKELLEILKDKGVVGMGGAMFPTSVKLCPPKPVDTLLVNGCECEPYLNGDNRLMIEHPEEILKGARTAQRLLGASKVLFAIEDNKKEAVEAIGRVKEGYSEFESVSPKTKYPQGAEKMLIKRVLDREVPEGGLPFDVGVVVLNVSTLYAIYRAVYEGMPLIERTVTVTGKDVVQCGNYIVKIGTPFLDILHHCFNREPVDMLREGCELKMGGPMMGIIQLDLNSAVIKGTTGLLLLEKPVVKISEENECIKCGRCVDVCPMELHPNYYAYYGRKAQWEKCVEYRVKNCIECGCCQYICSSKIDLMSFIKKAKKYANNKGERP